MSEPQEIPFREYAGDAGHSGAQAQQPPQLNKNVDHDAGPQENPPQMESSGGHEMGTQDDPEKSGNVNHSETETPQTNGNADHTGANSKDEHAQNGDSKDGADHHGDTKKTSNPIADAKHKLSEKTEKAKDKANPPGGYSDTPIPSAPDGYTVKFTFHRAEHLPVADYAARSSDPYLTATLSSPGITKRHEEDPDTILRTKTIHESTEPVWDEDWVVAGIPSSGFHLKCRLYDEDPSDHDDRLGNVTIDVSGIAKWEGYKEKAFDIKKRSGSKRAYAVRGVAALFSGGNVKMDGHLIVSIEVLGKSEPPHGRMYTVAPVMWTRHFSPMIGRLAGTKAPESASKPKADGSGTEKKVEKYDFQANQFQLQGPVPAELYHRFVEFKPFVKGMFAKAGLRGRILNKALHHQHARVYNYSATTEYGVVEPRSEEATLQFLEMAHFDEGGRIFTYVLTLDGLLRFTETGKEFGIDLLSKHTMHSNVNIYISCSGEFFIRRLAKPDKSTRAPDQKTHPSEDLSGGPPNEPPPRQGKDYELVIDNDSGTYRPKAELLPKLKEFLNANFPGLHVETRECTDKELAKMKDEQRKMKKKQGQNLDLVQNSDDDISSSDEEKVDGHIKRGNEKSKRERVFEAVEDPVKAVKDLIPGEKGKETREANETNDDMAADGGS